MARQCDFCGKKKMFGNTVSHANNRTRRVFHPNLRTVRFKEAGKWVRRRICTSCLGVHRHLIGPSSTS